MPTETAPDRWLHLLADLPLGAEEALCDQMSVQFAGRFALETAQPGSRAVDAPSADRVRLHVYTRPADGEETRARLHACLAAMPELAAAGADVPIVSQVCDDPDWRNAWKAYFDILHVGRRLVIRPTWRPYRPNPGEIVVDLDPGCAFGSGGHATTQQALKLAEAALTSWSGPRPAGLIDVGCGSGIVAMAAAQLGAAPVLALDIDPEAVAIAAENAALNGLSDRIGLTDQSLADIVGDYDVVVANILSCVLQSLRADLLRVLRPAGRLILAGILVQEEASFRAAFEGPEMLLTARDETDEWLALQYTKEPSCA